MSHHHCEEIRQRYIDAYVAGNAAGVAAAFTDDCMMLPPDGPIALGKAGVQAHYEAEFGQLTARTLSISPEEETTIGDWGYGAGTWAVTATLKATGATVQLGGKYLHVSKRQADGAWRIYRHCWNAPTQLAAMAG